MNESENLSRFERTRLLLGKEKLERFRRAHVLVLGVGGVGAYAAEQLARAGIGTLTLVDGDRFELTNCGRPKAEVVAERMREINPAGTFLPRVEFLQGDGIDRLLETRFDFAVDAIDSLTPKVEFLLGCLRRNIPVVSSMGSGGKVDPSLIQVADISKTHGCALARAVRTRLRAAGVTRGIRTVFSPEAVPPEAVLAWKDEAGHHHSTVGTVSYLPAIFGCVCASVVLRAL